MPESTEQLALEYVAHGWALVPLRADKRPRRERWNDADQCVTDLIEAAELTGNIGLAHAYSGTCCVDIDDIDAAEEWFAARGIDIHAHLAAPGSVRIVSGRQGRAKLLYRLPEGMVLPTRKPVPGLELRCATAAGKTVEDVLPPSIHPTTGKAYRWAGADWRAMPVLPADILAAWTADERAPTNTSDKEPLGLSDEAITHLLKAHDPDCGYDAWLRVGLALHHETGGDDRGLDHWDQWSAKGDKYKGRDDLEHRYLGFGNGNGPEVTARSLFGADRVAGVEEFSDLVEEVEAEAAAEAEEDADQPDKHRIWTAAEIMARPDPEWLVKGLLPRAGLVVMYGQPSAGKSFVALDLAGAIARGVPWRSRKVLPGAVLYIAAEGAGGFTPRLQAYCKVHGDLPAETFGMITAPVNLLDMSYRDLADRVKAWRPDPALIVIDTLARSMPGGDENTSADMGKVLDHCEKLHRRTGATVLLVHHSGKDVTRGARGWSGLKGAADAELEIERDGDFRSMRSSKQKDGADGDVFPFELEPVDLGLDADGAEKRAPVVKHLDEGPRKARQPAGKVERLVWSVVQGLCDLCEGSASVEAVVKEAVERLPSDGAYEQAKERRRVVRRALISLQDAGFVELHSEGNLVSMR